MTTPRTRLKKDRSQQTLNSYSVGYAKPPGAHQFKPGQSGNPKGRQKGSRAKFAEEFCTDFYEHWKVHGKDAIDRLCARRPGDYVKIGAPLFERLHLLVQAFRNIVFAQIKIALLRSLFNVP